MLRKKTRFVVTVADKNREVFSIGEGAKGDLAILFRGTDNYFNQPPTDQARNAVNENRISIHRSGNSVLDGTTLMRTLVATDGVYRSSAFIKNSKKELLWHVYSSLEPDHRNERYDPSLNKSNNTVVIGESKPEKSSLIYHVFVAHANWNPVQLINCRLSYVSFKYFKIIIYACHVNIPSSHFSFNYSLPTAPPTLNGKTDIAPELYRSAFPSGAISLIDDDIYKIVHMFNQAMFNKYVAALSVLMPALKEKLFSHKPYFTRHPIESGKRFAVIDGTPVPWSPPIQG